MVLQKRTELTFILLSVLEEDNSCCDRHSLFFIYFDQKNSRLWQKPVRPVSVPLTSFQQHDLIVLTEIHEAVDAFGELHHVLDGLGDLHGTELPHHLTRLHRTDGQTADM